MLQNDTDINANDKDGQTAMIIAAIEGHKEIVQILVQHGADISAILVQSGRYSQPKKYTPIALFMKQNRVTLSQDHTH